MAKGKKGFEPGVSGNPEGRPSGVPNKIARPIKEQLAEFLNDKIQELPAIWSKLNARDKAQFLKDLWPYYMARMQTIQMEVDLGGLNESQLDYIINGLLNKK